MHQLLLALQAIPGLVAAAQSTLPDATGQQKHDFVLTLAYAAAGIAETAVPTGWVVILSRVIAAAVTVLWQLGIFKPLQSTMPQLTPQAAPQPLNIDAHAA